MRGNSNLIRVNKADELPFYKAVFCISKLHTVMAPRDLMEAVIIFLPDLF
jgi:hypothetical protein